MITDEINFAFEYAFYTLPESPRYLLTHHKFVALEALLLKFHSESDQQLAIQHVIWPNQTHGSFFKLFSHPDFRTFSLYIIYTT